MLQSVAITAGTGKSHLLLALWSQVRFIRFADNERQTATLRCV
jgi:hypothetical protein